mmetsp:Transcript_10912/g.40061  ORF Transcript_10912/g.40061 Transcript_10912/m.40061 type:complete len:541 (-) Transcript_10912:3027-4649(-)
MSRPSFRSRALDINKSLPIVRNIKELDSEENVTRGVLHGHVQLDAENEEAQTVENKKKGGSEIPIPKSLTVASYETDYPDNWKQPMSYIRRLKREDLDLVEYDLDDEDEEWLKTFNNNRNLLAEDKFENMIYRLELACGQATDALVSMGAPLEDKGMVALSREQAFETLRALQCRHAVLSSVYDFWIDKRKRWQKPLLRRLQPPTSVNDQNPYNVFRPREKVHRPHTRRKRENDLASYQRLFQVRANLEVAKRLLVMVQRRERRKKELLDASHEAIDMRVRHKFDPRAREEDDARLAAEDAERERREAKRRKEEKARQRAEAAHLALLREGELGFQNGSAMDVDLPEGIMVSAEGKRLPKKGKRKAQGTRKKLPSQQQMAKLTAALEPCMLFAQPLDATQHMASSGLAPALFNAFPPAYTNTRCRARIGRGGRIVFDRCAALSHSREAFTASSSNGNVNDPSDYGYKTFEVNIFQASTSNASLGGVGPTKETGPAALGDGASGAPAAVALAAQPGATSNTSAAELAAKGPAAPGTILAGA